MTPRQFRTSWLPAVGLWGPRSRFCGNRLDAYRMLRRESLTRGLYPDSSPASSLGERAAAGGDDAGGSGSDKPPRPPASASIHNGRHGTRLQVDEGART
ncbi:MAG TPA: hypothetical protein VIG24_15605 [Acidimicrobiia bacterium]